MNMMQLFKVGDEISGYCAGYFGCDDYDDKVCVLVTPTYAVFECEDRTAVVLNYNEALAEDVRRGVFTNA